MLISCTLSCGAGRHLVIRRFACTAPLCSKPLAPKSFAFVRPARPANQGVATLTKASLLLQTPCTASPCKSKICTQAERLRAAPLRLHSFALQNPPRSGVGFVRSQAQPTAVQLPAQQSCATAANRRFASKQPFDLQASQKRSFCAQAPRCKSTICKRSNPTRRLHSFAVQGYGFVSKGLTGTLFLAQLRFTELRLNKS